MTITNFAAGELSQNLKGRVDIPSYYSGVQKLKNFEIIPTGGLQRRPGMQRMAKLHGECRLIPFILDSANSFVLELIPNHIYVWQDGLPKLDKTNNQIDIPVAWDNMADIRELQFCQNYDTLIFVHRKYQPFNIIVNSTFDTFSYGVMEFSFASKVNLDDDYGIVEVSESGLPVGSDGKYCVYDGHLWRYNGSQNKWEIQGDDPSVDSELFTHEGKYPGCVAFYQNRLFFASTLLDPQRIWASAAPDTVGTRYKDFSLYQKFITVNKVVKDPDLHLFTANINRIKVGNGQTVLLSVSQDFTVPGVLSKNATEYYVTNDTFIPVGTKVKSLTSDTITLDTEIKITEDKNAIVFSLSLWRNSESASADDYEYAVINNNMTTSDVAFYLEPASDQNDAIKWLAPGQHLVAGTESNVWNIPAGVNALNIACYMNGRYGSDDIQAHVVDNAIIFFAQGKRGIREYSYNMVNESFTTNNIALLAEQMLTESPAVDFDFMTNPYNKLVIVRADGTCVQLVYDRNNGVMGWNRLERAHGKLVSCAVIRGDSWTDLEYFAVKDGDEFYLELLNAEEEVYLDSYQTYLQENDYSDYATENVVCFNSTTGKVCQIDNIPADFMEPDDLVYVGYPFHSLLLSMPVGTGDISRKKRIVNLYVRFEKAFMPVMKTTDMPDEFFTDVIEPFSGVKKIDYPGASDIDVTFSLEIERPVPCNILSVDASVSS